MLRDINIKDLMLLLGWEELAFNFCNSEWFY